MGWGGCLVRGWLHYPGKFFFFLSQNHFQEPFCMWLKPFQASKRPVWPLLLHFIRVVIPHPRLLFLTSTFNTMVQSSASQECLPTRVQGASSPPCPDQGKHRLQELAPLLSSPLLSSPLPPLPCVSAPAVYASEWTQKAHYRPRCEGGEGFDGIWHEIARLWEWKKMKLKITL